jgi:hypothetical protein
MIFLLQIPADEIKYLKSRTFRNLRYTYNFADFVLDLLIYSHCNGVIRVSPMEIGDDLQTVHFLIVVNEPSTSENHHLAQNIKQALVGPYRGLSGMRSDPAPSIEPMTHCMRRGILHDRSLSIKEQK